MATQALQGDSGSAVCRRYKIKLPQQPLVASYCSLEKFNPKRCLGTLLL